MSAAPSIDDEWCPNCGEPTKRLNGWTGWCVKCSNSDPYIQLEIYLAQHADHIEHYIARGDTLTQAFVSIRREVRPSCICCGVLIPHANRNALFCTRNERCRTVKNRYHYLTKRKHLSKAQALAQAMQELSQR